jgi:hypothetical protein
LYPAKHKTLYNQVRLPRRGLLCEEAPSPWQQFLAEVQLGLPKPHTDLQIDLPRLELSHKQGQSGLN